MKTRLARWFPAVVFLATTAPAMACGDALKVLDWQVTTRQGDYLENFESLFLVVANTLPKPVSEIDATVYVDGRTGQHFHQFDMKQAIFIVPGEIKTLAYEFQDTDLGLVPTTYRADVSVLICEHSVTFSDGTKGSF